jgi:hypothetical protein
LLGCDSLLFRTRWYTSILEPNSSTGMFEMILRNERNAQKLNGDNMVLTLGDSRFAYAPRLANELTGSTGYVFRSGGLTKDAVYLRGLRELVDHLSRGADLDVLWLGKMPLTAS